MPSRNYPLSIGYPLDQFLDHSIPLYSPDASTPRGGSTPAPSLSPGALRVPNEHGPGTGNLLIQGQPGTGKSTLALQIAVGAALRNNAITGFVTLENSVKDLEQKAGSYRWGEHLRTVHQIPVGSGAISNLHDILRDNHDKGRNRFPREESCRRSATADRFCKQSTQFCLKPHVRTFTLPPLTGDLVTERDANFDRRFKALETILQSARALRAELDNTATSYPWILPLVAIDSLNAFTGAGLSRNQIQLLIKCFQRHHTIGVFVADSGDPLEFGSTLADIVVDLTMDYDNDYMMHYFEIKKSRYTSHVHGRHHCKTWGFRADEESINTPPFRKDSKGRDAEEKRRHGLVVLPSPHYVMVKTHRTADAVPSPSDGRNGDAFASLALNALLARTERSSSSSVVTIRGPRNTFKTSLAKEFLLSPALPASPEHSPKGWEHSVLFRLHNLPLLLGDDAGNCRLSVLDGEARVPVTLRRLRDEDRSYSWRNLCDETKVTINRWQVPEKAYCLTEVDFKSGALLPEELIQFFMDVRFRLMHNGGRVRRIVLTDIGQIGIAYPFLQHSRSAGSLFLTAFVHTMRNHGIDVMMVGTESEGERPAAAMAQACALSDSVLATGHCDVFGSAYAYVQRDAAMIMEGAAEGEGARTGSENVPTVLIPGVDGFMVDACRLNGLVGFETGHIKRPGATLYVYEEQTSNHAEYNVELRKLLDCALGEPVSETGPAETGRQTEMQRVAVVPITYNSTAAFHKSIRVLEPSAPLDETVLCAQDEFALTPEASARFMSLDGELPDEVVPRDKDDKAIPSLAGYYRNVLMLAYLSDREQALTTYGKVLQFGRGRYRGKASAFYVNAATEETLSCLLLDAAQKGPVPQPGQNLAEVIHLATILSSARGLNLSPRGVGELFRQSGWKDRDLPVVYLCWYSELCGLIREFPTLADRLRVAALPGGGLRGDWTIGIRKGSVSRTLGYALLRTICRKEEDYRRFVLGVGLPWRESFYKRDVAFWGWPNSSQVKLVDIHEIWRDARMRTSIDNYAGARMSVTMIARQLARLTPPRGEETVRKDAVQKIYGRLFAQKGTGIFDFDWSDDFETLGVRRSWSGVAPTRGDARALGRSARSSPKGSTSGASHSSLRAPSFVAGTPGRSGGTKRTTPLP